MELIEREEQVTTLQRTLATIADGQGKIAIVSGEAGIGKTALLKHFRSLTEPEATFLWGMCDDLYTPQALAPFYDIAFHLGGDLVSLLPEASNLHVIGHKLLEALQNHAGKIVVIIEDIHWADEATLDLIRLLSRRIETLPVLLVLTLRENYAPQMQALQSLLGSLPPAISTRITLKALSAEAVHHLSESKRRSDGAEIYRLTGGNPFYVTEMLATVTDTLPGTVRDALLARVSHLSEAARHVLDFVSIVPNHAEEWLIHAAMDVDAEALNELILSDIVTLHDGFFAFRHELARRIVADTLSIIRQRELHRAIFAALQTRTDTALARLVHHATKGDIGEAVVQLAPQAARQATAVSAYREAAAHYATTLRYRSLLTKEMQAQLLQGRAHVCYLGVDWDVALNTYNQALALHRQLGNLENVAEILCWLSRLAWGTVQGQKARRYALEAVHTVRNLPTSPVKALAYSTLAQWHLFYSNQGATLHWGEKALVLAESLGAEEIYTHTLTTLGTTLTKNIVGATGLAKLEASLQRALQTNSHDQAGRAYVNLSIVTVEMHQVELALHYTAEGMQYTDEHYLNTYHMYLHCIRGLALLRHGNWEAAERVSRAALDYALTYAYINRAHVNAYMALGCLAARRGTAEAQTIADRMVESDTELLEMPDEAGFIHLTRAEIAWYRGDYTACIAEVKTLLTVIGTRPHAWYRGQALYWLWRCGEPITSTAGIAEPYRLQIEGDWQGAAAAWKSLGCPYERAMALADGDENALREAFTILDGLGAQASIDYVRKRLRHLGVDSIPRGRNAATRTNPAGLTRRQMDVLALLAENLTNAEIADRLHISPKTVEHHVSAILSKLDVETRDDAIRVAPTFGTQT